MQFHQVFAGVLVVLALSSAIVADPLPEPAKGRRNGEVSSLRPKYRAATLDDDVLDESTVSAANKTDASSSGRLFMRKFLLFKNMFGTTQQQPIIPIIVTGGAATTGTTGTTPTTTVITETGTIPSATGIVTITPTTASGTGSGTTTARADPEKQLISEAEAAVDEQEADEPQQDEEAGVLDEQSIPAALAANSQEYVVTNEEMRGSADGKASQQPARINLRRKGTQNKKNGQVVSIRVPPRYRRYFKKGQTVMLSTNGANNNNKRRPGTKRIIRKRPNKNRRRKVKRPQRGANKKRTGTRVVAA